MKVVQNRILYKKVLSDLRCRPQDFDCIDLTNLMQFSGYKTEMNTLYTDLPAGYNLKPHQFSVHTSFTRWSYTENTEAVPLSLFHLGISLWHPPSTATLKNAIAQLLTNTILYYRNRKGANSRLLIRSYHERNTNTT